MRRIVAVLCAGMVVSCSGSHSPGEGNDPLRAPALMTVHQASDTTSPPAPTPPAASDADTSRLRTVRLSGVLEAVRSTRVVVPQVTGPAFVMTLTRLVENGATVEQGDVIAEFDALEQLDQARESAARYEDLSYQVRQREADNVANAEQRRSALAQAEADLEKALLEVSKASVLSEREATQNELRAAKARAQVESLARTHPDAEAADLAALRILELQRDRQRAAYERAQENLERLRVRAPLSGMVAHSTRYSNGSMVRPQEGDRMTRNNALLSIFDPGEMLVRVSVAEPDGALLHPGLKATVYVDAYPDLEIDAHFVSASPVAAAPLLSNGVKSFRAVFRLDERDPRLMPDLSAAVVFEVEDHVPPGTGASSLIAANRGAP